MTNMEDPLLTLNNTSSCFVFPNVQVNIQCYDHLFIEKKKHFITLNFLNTCFALLTITFEYTLYPMSSLLLTLMKKQGTI